MSATKKNIYSFVPAPSRGRSIHLGGDPKGKNILYTNGRSVIIRSLANPLEVDQYTEHTQNATVARYSPTGFYIASGDATGTVRIWDTTNAEHILKLEYRALAGEVRDIAWDPESKRVCAVGDAAEKCGAFFFMDGGSSCGDITGHTKAINSCHFRPGRPFRAITGSDDSSINWYEGPPFKRKQTKNEYSNFVNVVRFNQTGSLFMSGGAGADGKIVLWDGKTADKVAELSGHTGTVFSACWKDDKQLMTCSADKTVKIWDVEAQTCTETYTFGDTIEDQQVGCLWQGDYMVSLSLSGDLNYLDSDNTSKPRQIITGHTKPVSAMVVKDKTIYSGDTTGRIMYWDPDNGCPTQVEGGNMHSNQVTQMIAAPDNVIVSCSKDDSVRGVDAEAKSMLGAMYGCDSEPYGVAAGRDGLAIVGTKTGVSVLRNGKQVHKQDLGDVFSVAISPDNSEVAVGLTDKVKRFTLNGDTLQAKGELGEPSRGQITALAYSPDGGLLAVGDSNRQITAFDTASGAAKIQHAWIFHNAKVGCIKWSPSGQYCASGSIDTHAFVWSVAKPSKRIQIAGAHVIAVTAVDWLDDNTLVTSGFDGCVKTWKITHH